MINDTYLERDYQEYKEISVFAEPESVMRFQCSQRLQKLLGLSYFKKGSKLFAVVAEDRIVAYTWLHTNYDPNGDIDRIGIKNYHIAGQTFVEIGHRGKRLSGKLKNRICKYAKENSRFPIYTVNSFDNIPIIKNNLSEHYKLKNVVIKLKKTNPLVL
jgi:hypothetical protein